MSGIICSVCYTFINSFDPQQFYKIPLSLHFTDKKIEAERLRNLPKLRQVVIALGCESRPLAPEPALFTTGIMFPVSTSGMSPPLFSTAGTKSPGPVCLLQNLPVGASPSFFVCVSLVRTYLPAIVSYLLRSQTFFVFFFSGLSTSGKEEILSGT